MCGPAGGGPAVGGARRPQEAGVEGRGHRGAGKVLANEKECVRTTIIKRKINTLKKKKDDKDSSEAGI